MYQVIVPTDSNLLRPAPDDVGSYLNLLDSLLNHLDASIYIKDADRRYLYVNRRMAEVFRRIPSDIIGRTDAEIFSPDEARRYAGFDDEVFATGQPHRGEEVVIDPDGSSHHFWSTKRLLLRQGHSDWLIGFSTDITKPKQAQAANLVSEETFKLAFSNANTGMCLVDTHGILLEVNDSMSLIFGYSRDELEGMSVNDLSVPDDLALSVSFIGHAVKGETDHASFEKRYRHKNGNIVHGQVSSSLVHDAQGQPLFFISQVQDITRAKRVEEELRTSEQRHRLLAEHARDVIWTMAANGRITYISPAVEIVRGYTPAEAICQGLDEILTPDSQTVVVNYFATLMQALESGQPPEQFKGELEYRCKDGSTFWTEVIAIPMLNSEGGFVEILGVTRDISERKRYEAGLRKAHDQTEAVNRALQAANAELLRLATTDVLTGVWNRRYFEDSIRKEMAEATRYCQPLSLLMLDIDHFKRVNDRCGHQAGDQVLVEVTRVLQQHLRISDLLARWGGEEFVVLMPHCSLTEAMMLAEKLRILIASIAFTSAPSVTASFGVAEFRSGETSDSWLKRVDQGLYAAKDSGRNKVLAGLA